MEESFQGSKACIFLIGGSRGIKNYENEGTVKFLGEAMKSLSELWLDAWLEVIPQFDLPMHPITWIQVSDGS